MSSVTSSVSNVAKNVGTRLFLGLASQFSKPSALARAPPSSLLPLSKAYNSLSPMAAVNTRRKQQIFPTRQVLSQRNISGAGVILFDKNTDSVILFENVSRNCFEEPGGFLKPNYDPATSASQELFEESCTLISSKPKSNFLPHYVDISGRSNTTFYRSYFMNVEKPPSYSQYLQKRSQLQQQGYPSDFLETKGIAHIPVPHLAASLEKPINWELDHNIPVYVKDIYGKEVPVSKRTLKIFKEGGLKILDTVSENSNNIKSETLSNSNTNVLSLAELPLPKQLSQQSIS